MQALRNIQANFVQLEGASCTAYAASKDLIPNHDALDDNRTFEVSMASVRTCLVANMSSYHRNTSSTSDIQKKLRKRPLYSRMRIYGNAAHLFITKAYCACY